jgi:hypothetical protein
MLLDHQYAHRGHIHRLVITLADDGWDVSEEQDSVVVMHAHRHQWQRVERDRLLFEASVSYFADDTDEPRQE